MFLNGALGVFIFLVGKENFEVREGSGRFSVDG